MEGVVIEQQETVGVGIRNTSQGAQVQRPVNTLHPLWGAVVGELKDQTDLWRKLKKIEKTAKAAL